MREYDEMLPLLLSARHGTTIELASLTNGKIYKRLTWFPGRSTDRYEVVKRYPGHDYNGYFHTLESALHEYCSPEV